MEAFGIKNLSFSYPGSEFCALSDLNLSIHAGEWVTICGRSGCGKTTLLRLMKPSVAPGGTKSGEILFNGRELSGISHREQTAGIGFVMQNPDSQIVTDKVWHELAFGLESLGLDSDTIRLRCAEMAAFFGIRDWFYSDTASLSGGQKQLLNLASVMVMQPSVLLLDEPTSQLDPISAAEFLQAVHKLNRELGVTVIISEHRLEETLPLSDRLIVIEGGRIFADGTPRDVIDALQTAEHGIFRAMPTPVRVHAAMKSSLVCPLTVRQGREWLTAYAARHSVAKNIAARAESKPVSDAALEIKKVWFRYSKDGADVLRGADIKVYPGSVLALVGGNGAGKTTALSLAAGIISPQQGKVIKNGRVGLLTQSPQAMFLRNTLRRDLEEVAADTEAFCRIVELCNLEELLERHPFDLSGGELQRAALAKVLLTDPDILLLDEPTKGMDAEFKAEFLKILLELRRQGTAVLMVSHDVEFCAECADVCAMMFDGEIISYGTPQKFFGENSFYTTSANRMARGMIDGAITAEDIILACGGGTPEDDAAALPLPVKKSSLPEAEPVRTKKAGRHTALIAAICCLVLVPLTIWAGIALFADRKYYLISLTVIAELMIPFFLLFEKRKPRASEVVLIAALCAIGVIGRAAFVWLPQFKPVAALIIIAAVALGAERGFLIGALTCFASNIFFGQGPWTLWQMFAFGLIGFFAGLIFRNRKLAESRPALCAYGFLSIFVLYGGILNPAAEIMFQGYLTWPMLIASYAAGFPFDLIHAIGTAVFLWIAAKPMLSKLERIKKKYGIE